MGLQKLIISNCDLLRKLHFNQANDSLKFLHYIFICRRQPKQIIITELNEIIEI